MGRRGRKDGSGVKQEEGQGDVVHGFRGGLILLIFLEHPRLSRYRCVISD